MVSMLVSRLTFGLLTIIYKVVAYQTGAPETICINHVPHHHHISQQYTPSPYGIEVSPSTYNPGDILTVRLFSLGSEPFKGYQVRAQQVGGDIEKFIGSFIEVPDGTQLQAWYPDDLDGRNCFTHRNNAERTEVEVKWKAPNISVGDVIFRGTMMKDFEHFWVNVTSNVLTSGVPKEEHYEPHVVTRTINNHEFAADCGKTKGCVLYPKGCSTDCTHVIAYQADTSSELISFELYVKNTPAYISLGFSDDLMMGNDSTVSCVAVDEYSEVHYGYSPALYNERHKLKSSLLTDMAVERKGDAMYCSFKRSFKDDVLKFDRATHEPYFVNFDFTVEQYLQLAWGGVYHGTPIPWKHDELPLVSPKKVDLMKPVKLYASQIPYEYKVHGSLGIAGWVFLGSLGMLISRHFKLDMRKTIGMGFLSKPVWFHLHFWLLISCIVLASVAVIFIFVYLEAWTKYADVHAVFGLIAVGLGLFNVLGGLLRPKPSHSFRPVFTWTHRLTAVSAFIAAWVTVFLGANVSTIGESVQTDMTTILIVWLLFVVLAEVLFELLSCWSDRKDMYTINEKGDSGKTHPLKWLFFAVFILFSTGMFVAFTFILATA